MTQEDLLRKILNDDIEQFSIQEIFEIFVIIFNAFEKNSRTVESIKSKITKNEWDSFVNGLTISLFASLYASKLSEEEALKLGEKLDGVLGVMVTQKKINHDELIEELEERVKIAKQYSYWED